VVYPLAKGTLQAGGLAFLLLLMFVMFLVVLLEHRRLRRRQAVAVPGPRLDADPDGVL
jgi:hypothetical protein